MSSSALVPQVPSGGFNFSNYQRNVSLCASGFPAPKTTKTGTTIVGCIFGSREDIGVCLGADTRATSGNIVADKNCEKIHRIAERIYCCGAGTAADTEFTTKKIESQLELLKLNLGREVPVVVANRLIKQLLFRHQGHISAALVLGGVDNNGAHIYCIYPHGSTDRLPYATMGSGSLAAMSVFEGGWKDNMTEAEATKLVRDAIAAGITNDLGSGSNVDINIIRKNLPKPVIMRNMEIIGVKGERMGDYTYPKGTTKVLKTEVIPIKVEDEVVERMDTDQD
ncbi:proteasome subunit beta type-7 [Folsomia candida]|uniref:proteasome endopeptidase complex n=1 Tax=Folsomia candida TaxID=158441 RepID=A0A226EFV4_FOLCA|nr:proteasome subunit beta type-7 [Folsomia candida]OXA56148.1 Proteasome subunit beta type-7 [Folsomia candida]